MVKCLPRDGDSDNATEVLFQAKSPEAVGQTHPANRFTKESRFNLQRPTSKGWVTNSNQDLTKFMPWFDKRTRF
jgi:hypothetical protein